MTFTRKDATVYRAQEAEQFVRDMAWTFFGVGTPVSAEERAKAAFDRMMARHVRRVEKG